MTYPIDNPLTQQNQPPSDLPPPDKQKALEPLPDDITRKIFRYHDDLRTQALVSKAWLKIRNSDPGLLAIYNQLFNKPFHKEEVLSSAQYGRAHKAIIDLINKVALVPGGKDILEEIEVNSMNKKCYDLLKEWFEIKTTCLALLNQGETLPEWIQNLPLHIDEETKQRLDQWKAVITCSYTPGGSEFLYDLLGVNSQTKLSKSEELQLLTNKIYLDPMTQWIKDQNFLLFFSALLNHQIFDEDEIEFINAGLENLAELSVHDQAREIREKLNDEGIQRRLSEITHLHLGSKNLTTLPPEIGKLTALTHLDLYSNNLTILPPEIENLTALTQLDITYNKLTTLPPEIRKLTALTYLYLDNNNNLTSIPIDWILSRPVLQKEPFLEHANLLKSLRQFDAYISSKIVSEEDKFSNKVLGMLYKLHDHEENDPKWAENHLEDDLPLLGKALKESLQQEINFLREDQLTGERGLYWNIWDLAGRPIGDPLYGKNHCLDCYIRTAIAIARCRNDRN